MIINRTKELADTKGLSVRALAAEADIALGTALAMMRGTSSRISFDVLDRLCKLFAVQPGEILVWQPDAMPGAARSRRGDRRS